MTNPPDTDRELPRAIKPRNLALGIERIGFYSLSHRTLCALAFIVFAVGLPLIHSLGVEAFFARGKLALRVPAIGAFRSALRLTADLD